MTWFFWAALAEGFIILGLLMWASRLLDQLDTERQRIALLRRLR